MKISRFKKSHKTLVYFSTNFDYREPYQVLVDATFCQAALEVSKRKHLTKQILPNTFLGSTKLKLRSK